MTNVVYIDGKRFEKVIRTTSDGIDQEYLLATDREYLVSVDRTSRISGFTRMPDEIARLSDHIFLAGTHPRFDGLTIGTFNAPVNRMALRKAQGLHNSGGDWYGYLTGDSLMGDQDRREYIIDYIVHILEGVVLLLLQEIDYLTYLGLRERGVNIVYSEEVPMTERTTSFNSNRGGVAIASISTDVEPMVTCDDIWDHYVNSAGKQRRKHVGITANVVIRNLGFSVSCFHCDGDTPVAVVANCLRARYPIVGGDFNTGILPLERDVTASSTSSWRQRNHGVVRITGEDPWRRYCRNGTIDGVFVLDL